METYTSFETSNRLLAGSTKGSTLRKAHKCAKPKHVKKHEKKNENQMRETKTCIRKCKTTKRNTERKNENWKHENAFAIQRRRLFVFDMPSSGKRKGDLMYTSATTCPGILTTT
jgi:hypothetical protein